MHEGEGSVHRAAWPKPEPYEQAAFKVSPDVLTYAGEALAALRKIKSEAKVSMKTPILSVTLDAVDDAADSIKSTLGDTPGGRVVGNVTLVRAGAAIKAVKWRGGCQERC